MARWIVGDFQEKYLILQDACCGYLLELPLRGNSDKYTQYSFLVVIEKNKPFSHIILLHV